MDFIKTEKSRYLESETLIFLQIKKMINFTSKATLLQRNSFLVDVTFKVKLGTQTNLNIQNSMVTLIFSVFDRKRPFGVDLVQIIKIASLN